MLDQPLEISLAFMQLEPIRFLVVVWMVRYYLVVVVQLQFVVRVVVVELWAVGFFVVTLL